MDLLDNSGRDGGADGWFHPLDDQDDTEVCTPFVEAGEKSMVYAILSQMSSTGPQPKMGR